MRPAVASTATFPTNPQKRKGGYNPRRVRLLQIALKVGLFSITAIVVYAWMTKLSSDLAWDDAFNFRVYARSPLTAIALYHEPNNHPLDSFVKSIFFSVLRLDEPASLKITGFLYVVGYLALGWAAWRRFSRDGWVVGATLLVPLLLLTRGINFQAVELRGYFLSVVLQAAYLFLLCRETGLLRSQHGGSPMPRGGKWARPTIIRYSILSALILWTLPSNILALPPIWLLTVAAFPPSTERPGRARVRHFVHLAIVSGLFAALLYVPIFLSLALQISQLHNIQSAPVDSTAAAIRDELALMITQLAPRGISEVVFGWALAALLGIALVAATRSGRRLTTIGLGMIAVSMAVRLAFAAIMIYPTRLGTALVPPLLFAMLLIVYDLTSKWRPRTQIIASLALMLCSFAAIPAIVREETSNHTSSEVASFLRTYCRPEARNVLVVHGALQDALLPVSRAFGPEHVVASLSEMDARFRNRPPESSASSRSWKRRLRDLVLPEDRFFPVDASKVEILVLIDDDDRPDPASAWLHPVLDSIKARLSRHSEFGREQFHIHTFEAP